MEDVEKLAMELGLKPWEFENFTPETFKFYCDAWSENKKSELVNLRLQASWLLLPYSPVDKAGKIKEAIKPEDICLFPWEVEEKKLKKFEDLTESELKARRESYKERIEKWGVKKDMEKIAKIKKLLN